MNIRPIIRTAVLTAPLLMLPIFASATPGYTYLALGDSISFGYNPTVTPNPANYIGYPEIVAVDLNLPAGEVNASCPGQTSGSFLDITVPDNHCEDGFKHSGDMHTTYTGSQMAFALSQVTAPGNNINLVTLSIGGDDLILLQEACSTAPSFVDCVNASLPGVLSTYGGNLYVILKTLREAPYTGNIVLSEYASPSTDPLFISAISALNGVMVQVGTLFGATFADGFTAFQTASAPYGGDPCAARLLVRLSATSCDVHPTIAGQNLLAAAVLRALDFPTLTSGAQCNGTYSGTFRGNVTVAPGQNCLLVAGGVTGNIALTGGALTISNVTIGGNVQAQNGGVVAVGPGAVVGGNLQIQNVPTAGMAGSHVCGTTVNGNLQVQNNGIPVAIGSGSPICGGNVVKGNLQVQNNTGSTVILNNNVTGNLQDQNNAGLTEVFNNSVAKNLQCENNTLIQGGGNTARQKQGQCATF